MRIELEEALCVPLSPMTDIRLNGDKGMPISKTIEEALD